jgi:hypothetical protein
VPVEDSEVKFMKPFPDDDELQDFEGLRRSQGGQEEMTPALLERHKYASVPTAGKKQDVSKVNVITDVKVGSKQCKKSGLPKHNSRRG